MTQNWRYCFCKLAEDQFLFLLQNKVQKYHFIRYSLRLLESEVAAQNWCKFEACALTSVAIVLLELLRLLTLTLYFLLFFFVSLTKINSAYFHRPNDPILGRFNRNTILTLHSAILSGLYVYQSICWNLFFRFEKCFHILQKCLFFS